MEESYLEGNSYETEPRIVSVDEVAKLESLSNGEEICVESDVCVLTWRIGWGGLTF